MKMAIKFEYAGHSNAEFDGKKICCVNLMVTLSFKMVECDYFVNSQNINVKSAKFSAAMDLSVKISKAVSQINPIQYI